MRQYSSPWFDYLFVAQGELEEILTGTGWQLRRYIAGERPLYIAILEKAGRPR